jgi:hypothetical protein
VSPVGRQFLGDVGEQRQLRREWAQLLELSDKIAVLEGPFAVRHGRRRFHFGALQPVFDGR